MKPRHTMIAVTAVAFAAFLTGSASAENDSNRNSRNADAKPYLAQAYAQSQSQAILLQRMQANCPAETKRAVMVDKQAPLAWFGCWREKDGKVEIAFEDGDFLRLEHDSLTWLSEVGT